MKSFHRVLRNSVWGVASEVAGGAVFFLAFILIARHLGTAQFGIFSFVLAFIGLSQMVADFGLTNILVRDLARKHRSAVKLFAAAAFLVGALSLAIFLAMAPLIYWRVDSPELIRACLLMGAAAVLTFQATVFAAVCRAHEDMGFNAAGNVTYRLFVLVAVWIAIHLQAGLTGIALAYLLAGVFQCGFFYVVVRTHYFRPSWRADRSNLKYLLAESYLVGTAMVFRRSVIHVGTLFLAAFSTPHAVGLLNAALRIMQVIEMLPATLAMPLLPPFSRLAMESRERLFQALGNALRIFVIIAFPLCSAAFLLAPAIIDFTFGPDYRGSVPTLQVLSLTVILLFPTGLYIHAFSALNSQRSYTISTAICLAVNVLVCIALIPVYREYGAALAILAGELAYFVSGYVLFRMQGLSLSLPALLAKPVVASAMASPILLPAMQSTSLAVLVACTVAFGLIYSILIIVFKGIRMEELAFLKSAMRSRLGA